MKSEKQTFDAKQRRKGEHGDDLGSRLHISPRDLGENAFLINLEGVAADTFIWRIRSQFSLRKAFELNFQTK
jgi:hypothetical protein